MNNHSDLALLALVSHFLFVLAGLLLYAIGTHASGQRRNPSAALAWVLTITLLPYVGLPLYLLIGTRKLRRPSHRLYAPEITLRPRDGSLQGAAAATLGGMGLAPPDSCRKIRFHTDGQMAWNELETLINSALKELDICTFVLGHDALGRQVARLLEKKARAGVRVRLLLDAIGSWQTPSSQIKLLRAAGVQVQWYMPLLRHPLSGRTNLRNHRKLVIADGRLLWSGGRNLAAEYFTGKHGKRPWADLSFTIEGALVLQALALFATHWHGNGAAEKPLLEAHAEKALSLPALRESGEPQDHLAQMVPSGPDQAEDTVHGLLLTVLFRAEQRVLAVTPYFVPDDALLMALCLAARRGVEVDLVVPARSNHRLADVARARALRDLVAAGGRVRLAPGMVHAKAFVVDGALALCGSLNLDSRSLFLNFELMLAFYDKRDIDAVTQWIDGNFRALPDHRPAQPSLMRDIAEGTVRWLGFQI